MLLSGLVLAVSLTHHWQLGMTPLGRNFHWPQVTAHHRLAQEFIAMIPPDAALSAQANLYPHVALRRKAYLFPAVNDAEYVFLDVTSPTYPIDVAGLRGEVIQVARHRGLRGAPGAGRLSAAAARLAAGLGATRERRVSLSSRTVRFRPARTACPSCSVMRWSWSATITTSTTW